jgi:hypothetical protein
MQRRSRESSDDKFYLVRVFLCVFETVCVFARVLNGSAPTLNAFDDLTVFLSSSERTGACGRSCNRRKAAPDTRHRQ